MSKVLFSEELLGLVLIMTDYAAMALLPVTTDFGVSICVSLFNSDPSNLTFSMD